MKTTFFFLSILFVIASCTNVKKSERLNTIDQLNVSVDSLQVIISANRADSSFSMSESAQGIELSFKKYYYTDSVDRKLATDINDLKQARKVLGHLNSDCLNLLKGCKELKESLRLLRYDIDNADGDRKKYNEYIAHEQSKMGVLNRMGDAYIKEREKSYATYNRLYSSLSEYAQGLIDANAKKKKKLN